MLLSCQELLTELRGLGILTPAQAARAAEAAGDEDPAECAARLVAMGLLTPYQSERLLAGKGRRLVIGPYVLLDRLGRGGMGHVYKARHRLLDRVVALKIVARLRPGRRASAARRRFLREVRAVGRLRHPGIVGAHDAGAARGRLYLAMEYVEGIDLEQLVARSGPLSVDLACEVVRQAAEALHHAHDCGLVHRDVKPSNLLLAPPGVSVKLLDLGLAAFTNNAPSPDAEEPDPELCGTPDFMDPESGGGLRPVDARADLYSLGCTFYFLLTGRVPHPGGTWTEKMLRHHLDLPEPVEILRPDVPPEVAVVVGRLMAQRPEDRYPTAAAAAADLSSLPPRASQVESAAAVAQPKGRVRRRSWHLVRRACIAVLLGVAAGGGARQILNPSRSAALPAPPAERAFQIEGRTDGFATLAQAIVSARDGDTVIVGGTGPMVTPPLDCRGKALTIRARHGDRPCLTAKPGDDPWRTLVHADRRLVLEGLDLEGEARPQTVPLVCCEGAPLRLVDCRLTSAGGAAVVVRRAEEVIVESCRIAAGDVGLSVEVGRGEVCRVRVADTRLSVRATSGATLSFWGDELQQATPIRLELEGDTISAGRMTALRALSGGLTITARGNHFAFRTALLSYTECRGDGWRATVWQGGDNVYEGPPSWLWVDDRPLSLTERSRPSETPPR